MFKKKKKTILFPCLGNSAGGSHLSTITFLKKIKLIGYDYVVLLINGGVLENILNENKIKYVKINIIKKKSFYNVFYLLGIILLNFKNLRKVVEELKPYAIHTNELEMHYLWSIICWILGIPHIWHQHSAFYSKKNVLLSSLSSKIITVSRFCKESFVFNMSKRAKVVYNPFDILKYQENRINKKELLKKLKLVPNKKTISFFGNESYQKGLNFFIEIIKKVDLKYKKKFNYLIVGNIKNKKRIYNLKLKGKINILCFNNFVKDLIQASDIIIFPSKNEGFGRVLIEAMLLKTFFVASNSGSHKELIVHNQNGFISTKYCITDYVELIEKISENFENYNEILNNAYKFAKSKFNVQNYVNDMKKHYDDLNNKKNYNR